MSLLKAGQLDAAIVSGGIVVPDDDEIMVVGALQLEAVHVLVRKDMVQPARLSRQFAASGLTSARRAALEWLLARDFLTFARLKLPSGRSSRRRDPHRVWEIGVNEQVPSNPAGGAGTEKDKLIAELPDCVVGARPYALPSSPTDLSRPPTIKSYRYQPREPSCRTICRTTMPQTTVLHREYLERTVIPMSSYFTTRGYPAADCETVGSRTARSLPTSRLTARAVQRLTKTLFEGQLTHRLQPKSPREVATPYAIHPAALAYFDRDKPLLVVNKAMEWFSKGLSIFGAFSAGALSLYSLLRRKKARTPAQYFAAIRKLESTGLNGSRGFGNDDVTRTSS